MAQFAPYKVAASPTYKLYAAKDALRDAPQPNSMLMNPLIPGRSGCRRGGSVQPSVGFPFGTTPSTMLNVFEPASNVCEDVSCGTCVIPRSFRISLQRSRSSGYVRDGSSGMAFVSADVIAPSATPPTVTSAEV